ncbi:MAG TPA: PAS domain S-box protein [Candidatus Limnocylindrales bacterium]|nr:PAS domain S-box protein [Candidatus Limnocylindrales bacterium]
MARPSATGAFHAAVEPPAAELLGNAVMELARLLAADGALAYLLDEETGRLRIAHEAGLSPAARRWVRKLALRPGEGLFGKAVAERSVQVTGDYPNDASFAHASAADRVVSEVDIRSMVAAPLVVGEMVFGALGAFSQGRDAFGERDVALVRSLADHAAAALVNARLYERLRQSEARYRFLVESSPDIVFATDAEGIYSYVSDSVERLLGWLPVDLVGRHFSALIDMSTFPDAGAAWQAFVERPGSHQVHRFALHRADGGTTRVEVNATGMTGRDGRFAGIHGSARDITEREALEAELRRQAAEIASSEERTHLARELHDSVTQTLFSMTLLTRSIGLLLERDPAAVPPRLAELQELERAALAEMRSLIFELQPGALRQEGLEQALRTHAAAIQRRIGLPVVVEAQLDGRRLSPEMEDALFRIAQEALHNIVKHAAAGEAWLSLAATEAGVRLVVSDDGCGFDPGAVPAGHLGLAAMRTRAEQVGGSLRVDSRPGGGTSVSIDVPLRAPAGAPAGGGKGGRGGPAPMTAPRRRGAARRLGKP